VPPADPAAPRHGPRRDAVAEASAGRTARSARSRWGNVAGDEDRRRREPRVDDGVGAAADRRQMALGGGTFPGQQEQRALALTRCPCRRLRESTGWQASRPAGAPPPAGNHRIGATIAVYPLWLVDARGRRDAQSG